MKYRIKRDTFVVMKVRDEYVRTSKIAPVGSIVDVSEFITLGTGNLAEIEYMTYLSTADIEPLPNYKVVRETALMTLGVTDFRDSGIKLPEGSEIYVSGKLGIEGGLEMATVGSMYVNPDDLTRIHEE